MIGRNVFNNKQKILMALKNKLYFLHAKYFTSSHFFLLVCCLTAWRCEFLIVPLVSLEDNENDREIDDLLTYFQQQLTLGDGTMKLCEPETDTTPVHISGNSHSGASLWTLEFTRRPESPFFTSTALPFELLMYIFRWVVSCDLDLRALEQLSLVCRGFYICARWVHTLTKHQSKPAL